MKSKKMPDFLKLTLILGGQKAILTFKKHSLSHSSKNKGEKIGLSTKKYLLHYNLRFFSKCVGKNDIKMDIGT